MTEVYDHNPSEHEDPSAAPTWLMGAVGTLLLVAILLGLTALYYNVKAEEVRDQVIVQPYDPIRTLRRQQAQALEGPPRWVTRQETGKEVRALVIPIERAMELVVEENR